MKLFAALLTIAATVATAPGTAQIPDKIIYNGEEYRLNSNPMEAYFEKHPEKKPKGGIMSTALWRGYMATFAITNNVMTLHDIAIKVKVETKEKGQYPYEWKSVKSQVVTGQQPMAIDWFTGILVIPTGELVNYVHMGYGSTYSSYILLEIKEGKLRKERTLDQKGYEAFQEEQYQAFKKTKIYKDAVKEMKDYDPKRDDRFIRSYFSGVYTSMLFEE